MVKKGTTGAVEIMHRRFIKGDKKRLASIERERKKLDLAQQIYDFRIKVGLTQKQFANILGTTQFVINRLENADYEMVPQI